jgi:phage gp29-like protein
METRMAKLTRWIKDWTRRPRLQAARTAAPVGMFIRPEMQHNWLAPSVRWYTPDRVEAITRNALAGDLVAQWELFDLMERTWPRLAKNLKQLKDKAVSVNWQVQPWSPRGGTPSPEAQRRAAALEDAIWSMRPAPDRAELDWHGLLFDLADAWGKAISVIELDWEPRRLSDGRTYICPRAAVQAPPHCYAWHQGRLWLRMTDSGRESLIEFPPDKWIIGICRHKSGHPAGSALLTPLAWFWAAANFAWEWWLNYAQIFGIPFRVAKYDPAAGPEVRNAIAAMLTEMGSAGWAALPAGTELQIIESIKSNAANPQAALVEAADKLCDILVLGQTLTSDVADGGSYAAARVHGAVLTDREQALCQWLANTLSQLARAFCRLNWGDESNCPWFLPEVQEPKDAESMARRDEILLRAGLPLPRQWLYDRHGIPAPGPDDDVLGPSNAPNPLLASHAKGGHASPIQAADARDPANTMLDAIAARMAPAVAARQATLARRFLSIIQDAAGPDEALQRLQEAFNDWDPMDLGVALEAAMQQAAALGLDLFAHSKSAKDQSAD